MFKFFRLQLLYLSRPFLFIIILAQAFCTSLWFAGNAVLSSAGAVFAKAPSYLAHLTSAIQFGFISGTFVFALLAISDRFSPSKVFFVSAVLGGLVNLGICLPAISAIHVLIFRFVTGFFLAGIYPVGMKIAADNFGNRLGKALGFLVGALVLGTALPHLLQSSFSNIGWRYVIYGTTAFSFAGGLLILLFIPDGPYRSKGQLLKPTAFMQGFRNSNFRSAAFGYFGHMWELYTFWTFVPVIIGAYNRIYPASHLPVSRLSFLVISSGFASCAFGGLLSQKFGPKKIAALALSLSLFCCLASPLFLASSSEEIFILFLIFWGLVVIADSPLFSTLVAYHAPAASKGTSLTIVNCIGFAITIASMQCINLLLPLIGDRYIYVILGIGPALGLVALLRKNESTLNAAPTAAVEYDKHS